MRPSRPDIAAPVLPGRIPWLNAKRRPSVAEALAAGPLLVHFFDFAQLNSVRALPYVLAWNERYREAGLTSLAIHSPRFRFGKDRDALAAAVRRLGIEHPVADDSGYVIWHDYGCRGWPSLFLFSPAGALSWYHFGEGEYQATELAVQAELRAHDPAVELPEPLPPLRPGDAPGALVAPPSEELFPGGSASEPWRAETGTENLALAYASGGVHATVAGKGRLRAAIDGAEREIAVAGPTLVELAEHERHSEHELVLGAERGVELYSVSFSAGVP